jgi:hypothetical protein
VANQESHAYEQQCDGCRQPRVIRLAHRPGDAVVPPGATRLLSAWRTSSLKSDESSSAATAGSFVRSGLRIPRAMQSSRRPGETPEAVAMRQRGCERPSDCYGRSDRRRNVESSMEAIVSSDHRRRMRGAAPAVEGALLDHA